MKALVASAVILFSLPATAWYSDVSEYYVFKDAIAQLTEDEVIEGYEDGTFKPEQEINRVEALKMIFEANEIELTDEDITLNFPDTDSSEWYAPYLKTGLSEGIVAGHDDGYFRPEDTVNRVEALKMHLLASDIDFENVEGEEWYSGYLQYGIDNALIIPNEDLDYLPGNPLSRGELAELIYRFQEQPFTNQIEFGKATFYSYSFDDAGTASGTPLDTEGFMAAHKTLPFGTWLRVTNLDTDLSVDVEVVDRGPYVDGRIVDLTPAAFDQIGALSAGILNVRVEVLK